MPVVELRQARHVRRRALIGLFIPTALLHAQQGNAKPEHEAGRLAAEYLVAFGQRFPEETHRAQARTLFDNRRSAYVAWSEREATYLRRLRGISPRLRADAPEAVTLGILQERLEMSQQFRVCRRELWNVSPVTGWFSEYLGYATQQRVASEADRRNVMSRWSELPGFVDIEIANLRYGLAQGYQAPRILVQTTIEQVAGVLNRAPAQSPFYAVAHADTSTWFRAAMDTLARERITPALARYQAFLLNEYLPQSRLSVGVGGNRDGAACFRALMRRYTSLRTTSREMDSVGHALLARGLEEQRLAALRRGGSASPAAPRGVAPQRELLPDSANAFRSTLEITTSAQSALQRAWTAAPRWFATVPNAPLPVIDSMPGAGDSDPTAQYVPADHPGGRARIFVNMSSLLKPGGRMYLERVMFHEGVPGHHFQIALQQQAKVHPLNRTLFNAAFAEGWAVYASNLADEMQLYSSDVARVPLVESLTDDGLTMLVQSGLHAHGWSRSQAIDTMLVYSGAPQDEIQQQVDYFIAAPAHALAYPVGAREIERLRQASERALGDRFDIRRFHALVLANGPLPLTLLRRLVARSWEAAHSSGDNAHAAGRTKRTACEARPATHLAATVRSKCLTSQVGRLTELGCCIISVHRAIRPSTLCRRLSMMLVFKPSPIALAVVRSTARGRASRTAMTFSDTVRSDSRHCLANANQLCR